MTKLIRKTILLTFVACFTTLIAKAQLGYDFSHYAIGFGAGFNQVYGDAETSPTTQSVQLNFTYNTTPFTNFVFEVQLGKLAGGDSLTTKSGRQFNNDFSAYILRGQLQLGEVIDYSSSTVANAFKNLYISAGAGFVVNHITNVSRFSHQIADFYTPGQNWSNEPFIPLRIGYEFKIFNKYNQPAMMIDLAYGYNYVFGDDLDGFVIGKRTDVYTQYSIGLKFAIGGDIVSYRKAINY